jgi:hypothetical protein
MEPERLDLSVLDVAADQLRYERLVRRVLDAAGPELERRALQRNPLAVLAGWTRPVLAAAALVGLLAGSVLVATERAGTPEAPGPMAEALGVPSPAADWLAEGREPTRADLVLAMESRR